MASNSLLECLVFARAASKVILANQKRHDVALDIAPWDDSQVMQSDESIVITQNWDELRRAMWNYVGIVRTDRRLARALNRVQLLKKEIQDYYAHFKVTKDFLELRNLVQVSELIILSALKRKESRGLHFTLDYPGKNDTGEISVLGAV